MEEFLPSPPPPPRPLAQLSNSMRNSGRLSSCSKNISVYGSDDDDEPDPIYNQTSNLRSDARSVLDDEKLVDRLMSSINFINNATDEVDLTTTTTATSTTTNNELNEQNYSAKSLNLNDIMLQSQNTVISNQNMRKSSPMEPKQADYELRARCTCRHQQETTGATNNGNKQDVASGSPRKPSELLLSLRLSYEQMPAHVRAAIRSILFIADTIKNEDDENSAIEDWESMSMVVDRLFLWIFFLLCTFGSIIILALAPSLYDQRASIDDKLRIDIPPSNCSAPVFGPITHK